MDMQVSVAQRAPRVTLVSEHSRWPFQPSVQLPAELHQMITFTCTEWVETRQFGHASCAGDTGTQGPQGNTGANPLLLPCAVHATWCAGASA